MKPILLAPNQPPHFYRGGAGIADFRGLSSNGDHTPEDWLASTTACFGDGDRGLSVLPDGRRLRDALAAEPVAFLGPAHVARFGADPAVLVKLLDVGERLPVHAHPDRTFARAHLGSPYGKSEAWIVIAADDGARVHLGFRANVDRETLAEWTAREDGAAMLDALHEIDAVPGRCIFVPAGTPHSIGPGVLILEVQEPSDLGVLLEWTRYGLRPGAASMGLALEEALDCVRRSTVGDDELAGWCGDALPAESRRFFRVDRLRPRPSVELERGYAIVVVTAGEGGRLETDGGALDVGRGSTVLVPYDAGAGRLSGPVEAVRCAPPVVES
jgi:mannose-6-phosphate isomerase